INTHDREKLFPLVNKHFQTITISDGHQPFPHRSSRKDVMKRLVLALLLFIFKHLAIAPDLTPEADITLVNPSMFACEGYRRHNMMLSMCSHKPPVHES
ncbi:hypothetical protein, partial [Klebsiella pneumoniae]|uniref:hypothetical protein n=2 Tax=Klebsiella/Raoultella group TaxID=2890311 RepID=UPI001AD88582